MLPTFSLPAGVFGRFAVVKLWPEIKTAEDECIARLKLAAQVLGIECVEVHADGGLLFDPEVKVSKTDVDFVIHFHYDTPKCYDAHSFVALWNPLKFYHEWGYSRTSRNLTTHDDFISCGSDAADDHVARMIRGTGTHLPARFHMYHATADVVHPPSLGDGKLFYAGINWEAISGGKSRHGEVLKRLDKTGLLRIYGPTIFQGVRVWAGYDSYVKEVPFDGVSMIDEISKAGIALVLSSQAHKDSALMSNRLFESVAAGALVICDENPFAKKFFGNSLLYIDSRSPIDQIYADITSHLEWARTHSEEALAMIAKAQAIFRDRFTLIRNVGDIYAGLAERKLELSNRQNPLDLVAPRVKLDFLMPEYSEAVLRAHISSVNAQTYGNFEATLLVDSRDNQTYGSIISGAIAASQTLIRIVETDYFTYGIHPDIKVTRPLGAVIAQSLGALAGFDAFVVVAPNERLYSNHIAVLAGALQRDANVHCAATAAVLRQKDAPVHAVHELIDFGHVNNQAPTGFARFIFRIAAVPADIRIALDYLHSRPMAVLMGNHSVAQQLPATVVIDLDKPFPARKFDDIAENEVIYDFSPDAMIVRTGFGPRLVAHAVWAPAISKLQLAAKFFNRRWIIAQIRAIQKQGLRARLQVLMRKLGT